MILKNIKLLVIDDHADHLSMIEEYLLSQGARVTAIECPSLALEELKETPFDCVISDVNMPAMTGVELLNKVRNSLSLDTHFILMSGGRDFTEDEVVNEGAHALLQKPIKLSTLNQHVQQCLN